MIKRGLKNRLAEVGKIKIGGKGETRNKSNGKGTYQIPTRFDHFVVTTTEKDLKTGNFIPDEKIMKKLKEEQGDKPTELKIRLLFDDIDLNFFTSYTFYQGAKCRCRGDGETAQMGFAKKGKPGAFKLIDRDEDGKLIDSETKTVEAGDTRMIVCDPEMCPMMQPDDKGATKCKPSGILSCILEDFPQFGGVYRFRTHSWNTLSNIISALEFIKTVTGGILVGLPLKMQMLKKSTEVHGNVNTVNIVFDGENWQQMRDQALIEMKNRTAHGVNMLQIEHQALEAGFTIDTDDPADVEAEFYTTAPDEPPPENITDRADAVLGEVEPVPEGEQSDPDPVVIGTPPEDSVPVEAQTVLDNAQIVSENDEPVQGEAEGELDIF